MSLTYVQANGLRLACMVEGSGPLLLCLHGFPDTPHTWRDLVPSLVDAGYQVVAPFMRGYPPTEAARDRNYSARQLGLDVLGLIDAFGAREAVVIGHDWGAFAAYAAASLDPSRVRRLVILSIPHPASLRPNLQTLIKSSHFLTFQLRCWIVPRLRRDNFAMVGEIYRKWSPRWHFSADDLDDVRASLGAPGGVRGALGYYWSFPFDASPFSATRKMMERKTTVPSLAFFGDDDGALDLSAVDRMASCFSAGCEIVRLAGVGHFIQREAPEQVARDVLTFLAR